MQPVTAIPLMRGTERIGRDVSAADEVQDFVVDIGECRILCVMLDIAKARSLEWGRIACSLRTMKSTQRGSSSICLTLFSTQCLKPSCGTVPSGGICLTRRAVS